MTTEIVISRADYEALRCGRMEYGDGVRVSLDEYIRLMEQAGFVYFRGLWIDSSDHWQIIQYRWKAWEWIFFMVLAFATPRFTLFYLWDNPVYQVIMYALAGILPAICFVYVVRNYLKSRKMFYTLYMRYLKSDTCF